MAPQATSAMTMLPQERQHEQVPASPRLVRPAAAAAEQSEAGLRPLAVAECAMCGITRPLGLLVPDGGTACADVRWYCKDAKSCTERWTSARPRRPEAVSPAPGQATAEPEPEGASAEQPDGTPEPVPSAT